MELKDIYELWARFEQSSVCTMELDFHGVHLKLDKAGKTPAAISSTQNLQTLDGAAAEPERAAEKSAGKTEGKTDGKTAVSEPCKEIKAPLVGVFYRAAAPGEQPFAEPGQRIAKGDVIGIIEAMKSMNEIIAEEDGTVTEIQAEDSVLVEYGQTLLTYRP